MPRQKPGNNPKKQSAASISQAEQALEPITNLTESAQIVLLKELARENTTEAADVLLAINTYAPLKEARKEARRSLIRLEATRHYPQWTPPKMPEPVVSEETDGPIRFWKGQYTDSRAMGEVQLMLFWEQGEGYKEVRTFGFLLEFWHSGVKDFFTEVSSKRQIEKRMENLRA